MEEQLVSIIIPFYNAEKTLDIVINSVFLQTYKNLEILLINDGSTDMSKEKCHKWIKKDKRIKYYELVYNQGVSKSRNFGIRKASGEYVCFIDADDYVFDDYIESFVTYADSSIDLVSCNFLKFTSCEIQYQRKLSDPYEVREYKDKEKYDILIDFYSGYIWNKMYKRKILLDYKIEFESDIYMGEDILFNFKYISKCQKCIGFNKICYCYKCDYTSASKDLKNTRWFSVYLAYEKILEMQEEYSKQVHLNIIYIYNKYLIEGLQRVKFFDDDNTKIDLLRKWKLQKNNRKLLKIKQRLKLRCFFYFPEIAYKYLRKKVIK